MAKLVLMRHGESQSVRAKRFSGWEGAALSVQGVAQARRAAAVLNKSGIGFDIVFTSMLERSRQSVEPLLPFLSLDHEAVKSDWRLNERHYGALQGMPRWEAVERYGAEAIVAWRRDYAERPPRLDQASASHPRHDPRYRDVPASVLPDTESLRDAALRVKPWWSEHAAPALEAGKNVLVVAHTASIRGITRIIENLDDRQTAEFRIPTASPVAYCLSGDLQIRSKRHLDAHPNEIWRRFRSKLKPTRKSAWR